MDNSIMIKNVSKTINGQLILNEVSMNVKKGEIYGFLGANGAGKTSLMRAIYRMIKPDSGSVYILGEEVKEDKYEIFSNIGSIIEIPVFYENMTAKRNLEIHCDYMGCGYKKNINEILSLVGLTGNESKRVKQFSLGMKQRLALGRALLTQPDILILDEPTNGLDPQGITQFRELIRNINDKYRISIIISSHILDEISKIADTIGIIHHGKILSEVSMTEIKDRDINLETYYLELIRRCA